MILTGQQIITEHRQGRITITPFTPEQVTPNSYDFRLSPHLSVYQDEVLDARGPLPTRQIDFPADGLVLTPGRLYLGRSEETIGSPDLVPPDLVPMVKGKSSIARIGLFIHMGADMIDPGVIAPFTLTLAAVQPVRIFPGMLIGQVVFWTTTTRQ